MKEFVEELIKMLTKKKEFYRKEWNRRWDDEDYGYLSAYEDSISIVNRVAEKHKGGWIPCSERLPKVTDYYLIQHTREICKDEMAVAFYSVEEARLDRDYTWEFETLADVKEVIAWMPLPEPYREE